MDRADAKANASASGSATIDDYVVARFQRREDASTNTGVSCSRRSPYTQYNVVERPDRTHAEGQPPPGPMLNDPSGLYSMNGARPRT